MSTIAAVCPHCDAKLKVQDTAAGKKIRCPKCKEPFTVRAEDEEPAGVAPKATALKAKRASRSEDQDEDDDRPRRKARADEDDDEDDDRPRRKKGKKSEGNPALLWGLIGGGAGLVLIGAVVAIIIVANSGKGSSSSVGAASSRGGSGTSSSANISEVKATDLMREFQRDGEEAFNKKYKGERLIVTGTVLGVDLSLESVAKPGVSLRGIVLRGTDEHQFDCIFEKNDSNLQALRAVKSGSTARINGKFSLGSIPYGFTMTECEILSTQDPSSSTGGPSSSQSRESGSSPSPSRSRPENPDVTMTADQWFHEWQMDKKSFQAKYKSKLIELTGTVDHEQQDDPVVDHRALISLRIQGEPYGLSCLTLEKAPWLRATKGSRVKIRGMLPEYSTAPGLEDVEIVEANANPAITISANDLATELAANPLKYHLKNIIVEGEVLEKSPLNDHQGTIKLKGNGKVNLVCSFAFAPTEAYNSVVIGSKVKVLASDSFFKDDQVEISGGGVVQLP